MHTATAFGWSRRCHWSGQKTCVFVCGRGISSSLEVGELPLHSSPHGWSRETGQAACPCHSHSLAQFTAGLVTGEPSDALCHLTCWSGHCRWCQRVSAMRTGHLPCLSGPVVCSLASSLSLSSLGKCRYCLPAYLAGHNQRRKNEWVGWKPTTLTPLCLGISQVFRSPQEVYNNYTVYLEFFCWWCSKIH